MDPFDEDIARARGRARRRNAKFPRAVAARYNQQTGRVEIELSNRVQLSLDPRDHQGLDRAGPDDLAEVRVQGLGTGVRFPRIDADIYVPGLLMGRAGSSAWMAAQLGAKGGRARSAAKANAARENGKKGGRPRKATASDVEVSVTDTQERKAYA